MCVMESPTQKFGYLDVKQSAKVKGRKMKGWKRKWVVLTKMTDMSSDQIVAKIDLYENESIWLTNRSEKTTFVFDNVTSIQRTRSRTHPHAFEVVQRLPELVFSGNSEIDSFGWILTLQQIFTPHLVEVRKDSYLVTIQPNVDATRWNLSGEYGLAVSPACVSINDRRTGNSLISWGLSTLMRFNVPKDLQTGESNVLVIECGKDGPTGLSKFGFISNEASDILRAIRQSICLALAQRQNARRINIVPRDRSISESNSEKQFQSILDSSQFYMDTMGRDRSGSESSGCTLTPVSPFPSMVGIDNPLLTSPDLCHGLPSHRSSSELGSLNESDEHGCDSNSEQCQTMHHQQQGSSGKKDAVHQHLRHSSLPGKVEPKKEDPGYAVIKEVGNTTTEVAMRFRRNTIATDDATQNSITVSEEPPLRPPPRRKRATSNISINPPKTVVTFEKEEEDRSDIDSAISSSLLSSSFDSAKLCAEHFINIKKSLSPMNLTVDSDMGSPSPPSPGCLNRRRSSSTPDLAAFWKHQAGLENVYEELDSIRNVVPRKSPVSPTDNPPALPARPFNLIVPTFRGNKNNNNNQTVVRLKKSFFFNKTKMQRGKSMISVEENRGCLCNYPYFSSKGTLLSRGNDSTCGQCGGSIHSKQYNETNKKTDEKKKAQFYTGSNSSLNDMYASISDFKDKSSKRRRSSEITRPSFLSSAESNKAFLEKDPTRFHSLHRRDPQQSRNFKDLMTYGSDETIENFSQQGASKLSTGSKDDPLISFFLDDDRFKSNPMVTGRMTGSQHLEPPTDDLLISPDSPKDFTKADPFIEDIFMMEPDFIENDKKHVLKPKNVGLVSNHSMNNSNADSLIFGPLTPESDLSSNPVTYTCLRNPRCASTNSILTPTTFNNQINWSNVNPFQEVGSIRQSPNSTLSSDVFLTPSPPLASSSLQRPTTLTNHIGKAPASESLYFSMQESKRGDSPTLTRLVPNSSKFANGNVGNHTKDSKNFIIDTCEPLTPEINTNFSYVGNENRQPFVNTPHRQMSENEDMYMCPGGFQQ